MNSFGAPTTEERRSTTVYVSISRQVLLDFYNGKPTTALKKPKLVLSISKNETNCRFLARSTKSADISNNALESGLKVFSNDLGGLKGEADIMLAMILPHVARLLPL